jgi:hypothetical protein
MAIDIRRVILEIRTISGSSALPDDPRPATYSRSDGGAGLKKHPAA